MPAGAVGRRQPTWPSGRTSTVEGGGAVGDPRREVGPEEDVEAPVDPGVTAHGDTQRLSHPATGAVGGDEVAGTHPRVAAGIAQGGRHVIGVLPEIDQLGTEAQVSGWQRGGVGAEHRLQIVLRAETAEHRAGLLRLGPRAPGDTALQLLAGQRARPDDEARALVGEPGGAHRRLDAALSVDLHGPRIDAAGLGMDGRARVPLHDQGGDTEPREQDRGGEPDRAAAGDEDVDLAHGGPS